jgi:hypothetical protein
MTRGRHRSTVAGHARQTLPARPGEVAWILGVPAALALLVAILALAPPLGRAFFEPKPEAFWTFWQARQGIVPEPAEHAAYLLALLAPAALAAVVLRSGRHPLRLPAAARRAAPIVAQALALAFAVVCLAVQRTYSYGLPYSSVPFHRAYFTTATYVAAAVLALLVAGVLSSAAATARAADWAHETRARRVVATVVAGLLAAVWLLTAVNSDATIGNAHPGIVVSVPFWLDEPFAVLEGHLPLVDFHAQYGHLMAYLAAATMAIAGPSLLAYSLTMVTASCLAMLALFAILRRVVRRSLLALALYVPVLSTSFFTEAGPPENRHGPVTLFSVFPMRYAGAYAIAWLTARHVDGAWPRRPAVLFFVGGLVLVNNLEFGLPAVGAALVAIAVTGDLLPARIGRLVLEAVAGLAGAFAAVTVVLLAAAGSLPHFELLLTFPRIYGVDGFGMLPMPTLGLHLVIYATFASALVLAAVRAASGSRDTLTAMLAWVGIFGLGAGSYYAGRSLPEVLISIFSPWALALALLLAAVVRSVLERPSRRLTLAEGAVVFAFALTVCSIAQTPAPWRQVERLRASTPQPLYAPTPAEAFIRERTRPGQQVAILSLLGHRIAYDLGLDNVVPYANIESMPTVAQLDETLERMQEEGVHRLFLPIAQSDPEQVAALQSMGYELTTRAPEANVIELTRAGRDQQSGAP